MKRYPCHTLTAGPPSLAAQTVLAALRAQYAGRMHRTRSSELVDSFSGELKLSLSQNQDDHSKLSELHTETNVPYRSISSQVERTVQFTQTTGTEKSSNYAKPPWRVLHEEKEIQCFNHSSDMELPSPEMDLTGQRAIPLFQSEVNTSNHWLMENTDNSKLSDYEDDNSLLALNNNKITVPGNDIPKIHPQGEDPFPRKALAASRTVCGFPQAAMLPKKRKEISCTKGKIRLKCLTMDAAETETVTHSPPQKRWRFGHLQMPAMSCSDDFIEKNYELRNEFGELNGDGDGGSEKMNARCLEEKREATERVRTMSKQEKDHLQDFGLSESVQLTRPWSDDFDKANLVSGRRLKQKLQPLLFHSLLNDLQESSKKEPQSSLDLADSSNLYHTTNEELCLPSENKQEPIPRMLDSPIVPLASARAGGFDQDALMKDDGSVDTANGKEETGPGKSSSNKTGEKNVLMEAEVRAEPEHSVSNMATETYPSHQDLSKQSKSAQLLNPQKGGQSLNERPEQTATPKKGPKKQELKTSNCSYVSKSSKQKCSAPEINVQIHSEGDKERNATSASSRLTQALSSDPRVCDASCLSQDERVCVLEEAARARALVVTMVYQDGTTQLDPEQKPPPAVCGLLVLLKNSLESLDFEQTGAAEERVLFLRLEQRPFWVQQDPEHSQDLFTREILLQMVCGMQKLVCYKAKDFLRTTLKHFSTSLSWKQVAACQVLDPQIAAWLLEPADSACCFQDLLNKHCTRPATHTPAQPAPGRSKVTQAVSSLSHLHRLMVELRNKLQTQGLWQLYFFMEQKMIPVLAAMESHRIHVDKENLKKTSEMLGTKMKLLEQEAHQAAGQQFLVSSSAQLRLVLFDKLRLHKRCENKKLPKTVLKRQQSTSEAALLQLQDLHPLPKIILEYRQLHKMKSTFVDGILSYVAQSFISSAWNQTSTVSGRLSARHPNFQALPKQPVQITKKEYIGGKEAELVTVHPRSMFIPQDGWTFLSADFCQVELRLLAHLSSDPELLRIFQNPEADVFTMLASQWKGVNEDSVSSEDRERAKRIVYSVVYGAGKERLSGILGVSAQEASRFQDSFLQTFREVQTFIQRTVQHCHKYGYVKSIMGRRRSLPHVHSTNWGIRNQAERQAVNFVVQGSAADLCKMAMIQICSHVSSSTTLTARLVAQIHDELLFEVEDSQVDDFAVLVKNIMESLQHIDCLGVSLSVPLKVSVSKGRSWGSMCELSLPHAAAHTSL